MQKTADVRLVFHNIFIERYHICFEKRVIMLKQRFSKIKEVITLRKYYLIALFIALGYIILSLFLINYFFVGITNFFKYDIKWYVISNIILTAIVSILLGISISMNIHKIAELKKMSSSSTVGIFGSFLSFLGIGCPSCSLSIATSLVPSLGPVFVLGALPLKGLEIQIISIILLLVSLYFATKENTCKI